MSEETMSGTMNGIMTKLLHSRKAECRSRSHLPMIYQTTTYYFENIKEMHGVFSGEEQLDAYSRISGQNYRDLETNISILEGGKFSQVFASGMAAIDALFATSLEFGNRVVVSKPVYSGTYELLTKHYSRLGIEVKFFDHEILTKDFLDLLTPNTKIVFAEDPANPTLARHNMTAMNLAIKAVNPNILLVADNTFATPFNQRPLSLGADIAIESLTKYINGRGDRFGGSITTNSEELINKIRERGKDLGGMMTPETAWHIFMNIFDFPDRMKQHNKNGLKVAEFLKTRPEIEKVYYPGFSGMVSFELREESFEAARFFLDELVKSNIVKLSVSLGNADSLVCMPFFTTHSGLTKEEKTEQGISNKLIRFSVGREDYKDIESALAMALEKI